MDPGQVHLSYYRAHYNHLISNKWEWENYFIKNNTSPWQDILLDLADFALQATPRRQFF